MIITGITEKQILKMVTYNISNKYWYMVMVETFCLTHKCKIGIYFAENE